MLVTVQGENHLDIIGFILYFKGGNMPNFKVDFYETANGKRPAEEFLISLDRKMRTKMLRMIVILSENGNELREPYSKFISDGIYELRAKVGSDISRILYFFMIGQRIILTNGFIKKTQKTPRGELKKAIKYRADYLRIWRII